MTQYIVRRLLMAVPSMLLVSLIIFSLVRLVDGDVVMARLAEGGYVTDDQLAAMRAELGIDRPFVTQYLDYMVHLMRGDFGKSLLTAKPVIDDIGRFFPATLELATLATVIAQRRANAT